MSQNISFSTLTLAEKATIVAGVSLVLLSFIALLAFLFVAVHSLAIKHRSNYWNICFLLNACALGGWMMFYTVQSRFGGGVMWYRGNLILLLFLLLTTFISILVRFSNPQRYIAIAVMILVLVAFNVAVPMFYVFRLLRPK